MPPINAQQIVELQKNTECIRNICILAHVDHGKTSLSDCLLATNGIISPKLAGKVRYLDSRPDEQLRGITMESSAISLFFRLMRRASPDATPAPQDYLINLIDSPGHIDFASEVSTASRLCDGAVVLVDAVEGVCSQTVTVLRQTWIEHIRPVLVINKMDRLITELQLSPMEAYTHLSKLLEQVNAVMGSFFAGERMEEDLKWREQQEARKAAMATASKAGTVTAEELPGDYEEKDDEDIYFAPEKGNVVFASAIDGWAFTVSQFAAIYEKKLGMKRQALEKVLWGDYYLDPKTKKVLGAKHLKGRNLKPMFVQMVLESLWAVYDATVLNRNLEKTEKIVASLNLKILPRDLRSKDTKQLLYTILTQWLPLSSAMLVTVIEQLPSPPQAQKQRMPLIIETAPGPSAVSSEIKTAVENFDTSASAPVVAYVSKMMAVPESELAKNQRKQLSVEELREQGRLKRLQMARALAAKAEAEAAGEDEYSVQIISQDLEGMSVQDKEEEDGKKDEKEHLIGFARIYSGTIKVGMELCVLGPKYNPERPEEHVSKITVTDLYYMMGRDLQSLDEVPAGNVFGIGGLEGHVLKSGTLCSVDKGGLNLAGVNLAAAPIVRVALEPENPSELDKMIAGLKMLEQADPCAEYILQENGEHVILTAGELHLERCLKDLRERFAKIEITPSAPIVPFRETIVSAPEMPAPKEKDAPRGTATVTTSSKIVSLRTRTVPLPTEITEFLVKHGTSIKSLYEAVHGEGTEDAAGKEDVALLEGAESSLLSAGEFKKGILECLGKLPAAEKEMWTKAVDNIIAFGPKRIGPNLLIDQTDQFRKLLSPSTKETERKTDTLTPTDFEDKITHAFQLSTFQGPLCNEPVQGLAVLIESFTISIPADEAPTIQSRFSKLTGEVITSISSAIKSGFLDWSPRLMLAMYSCDIQASTEVLGKVYSTITRRRGRIIAEEMKEGTPFFTISALLPVAESFGFGDDIRKRTSGAASPQLIFSGFEILDIDPFWEPFTEEELEDLGDTADKENVAKRYMEGVRERKGLFVQRKLVGAAEKQRTLKK